MALAEIAAVAGAISYAGVTLVGSLYYWKVGRHLPENIRDANQLYLCTDCRDYSRTYQQVLTHKIKRIAEQNFESPHYDTRCPHCLAKYAMRRMDDRDIHKWMDTEPKFPKLSLRGYLKYQKELKRLDQEFRDLRAIVAFQKYHQIEIAPPALHKGKGVSKQKAEGLPYTVHHSKKPENHEVQAVSAKEAARIEAEWSEEAEELVEKIRAIKRPHSMTDVQVLNKEGQLFVRNGYSTEWILASVEVMETIQREYAADVIEIVRNGNKTRTIREE